MKALTWLCLCSILILRSHAQGTLQPITFDGPPIVPPGYDIGYTNYEEAGVRFTPALEIAGRWRFVRSGGGRDAFPQNGSACILNGFTCSLRGVMVDGSSFGLYSVDLAEFSTLYPYPQEVPFFGYKAD